MPTLKVFLSSTARDLGPYREAVYRAIQRCDYTCVRMEDFGARDQVPDALLREKIAECGVLVGLVGGLYGSSPPGLQTSFTEREYEAAGAAGIPRLLFLTSEDFPLARNLREPEEHYERLEHFRRRVQEEATVDFFDANPDALATRVVAALRNLEERRITSRATATRMSDIFLSYASEDRATAERLVEIFRQKGWEVFWDRTIPIGKSWDEVLDEKLPAARAITALWSPDSVKSRWVRTEADFGVEHRKLFPAMIRPAHVPISFRLVQYADLSTWDGARTDHGELQRLLAALRQHLETEPLRESPAESGLIEAKPSAHPVFLGYARDDRARAEHLVQALEGSGLPVWWDFTISVGESFESSIQQALESSSIVLILWSPRGLKSDWVRAEAKWASERRKLVGVTVEPVSLPPEFGVAPSIDLSGWNGSRSSPEFVRLLQALGSASKPDVDRHEREQSRRIEQRSPAEQQTPVISEETPVAPRDQQLVRQRRLLPLAVLLAGLLALALASWFVWMSLQKTETRSPSLGNWPARAEHAVIAHADKIWVLGGERSGVPEPMNDVWSSPDGRDWEQVDSSALWPKRCGHAAVSHGENIWILGGEGDGREPLNDVWYGNGSEWRRAVARASWSPRSRHAAAVFKGKIWILGGYNTASGPLHDVWSSQDGRSWTLAVSAAPWPPRRSHAAVVHQNKIWILGGENHGTLLNDVWSSPDGVLWTQVTGAAAWDPRSSHTVASFNKKLWLLGGGSIEGGPDGSNDVWSSEDGARWTRVTEFAAWHARQAHASVIFQRRLWVLGGYTGGFQGSRLNDIWSSADGDKWQ